MRSRRDSNPESPCLLARARIDRAAFLDFYDQYSRRVLAYLTRRTYDPEVALDLTSETFALVLERIEQFRGSTPEEEQGWLFAIARSQLSLYWRRGAFEREAVKRQGIRVPDLADDDFDRILDLAEIDFLAPSLRSALAKLSADQRQAVSMRVLEDLSHQEIASRLGISHDVARSRVSRGLRRLAEMMSAASESAEASA